MGMSLGGWSLPARIEWIGSKGASSVRVAGVTVTDGANLLGYGPDSKAWTFTVTPTYQYKVFFARTELSLVKLSDITKNAPGAGFGLSGNGTTQFRGVLEAGFVF